MPSWEQTPRGGLTRRPRRAGRLAGAGLVASLVSGCGKQSILTTESKSAHDIALFWWWMLGAAAARYGRSARARGGTPGTVSRPSATVR